MSENRLQEALDILWCDPVAKERARLERRVIETATERYKAEEAAYCGGNTIKRTRALVKAVEAGKAEKEAVKALIDFESSLRSPPGG